MSSPETPPQPGRMISALPPAMRYPAYRWFWLGSLASVSGFQILRFGQFWLAFQLTGSPVALGYVGLANGIPAIFLNLFGGVAADRLDQRILITVSQTITACLIFLLATITLLEMVTLWQVLTLSFLAGAVESFDQPARRALYPHLVDRSVLMSAVALNSSIWPGTRIAAPAVAGFIIGFSQDQNPATAFYVAGASFLIMAAIAYSLKVPRVTRTRGSNPVHDIIEGLSFIKQNSIFSFLMAMTFFSSFFGNSYIMMMPIIAVDVLGVGANGQGLLMGVGAVGSLVVTVFFASRSNLSNKGMLIIISGAMSGLSVAAFALTAQLFHNFILAMVLIVVVGVFNTGFTTLTQSSLQMMVPDEMRGRVMGFYGMTYNIRPMGGMLTGALASISFIGVPIAIAIGGAAVAAFAIGPGMANRTLRNLDALLSQRPEETSPTPQGQAAAPSADNE